MGTYTLAALVSQLQTIVGDYISLCEKQQYFKDDWKLDDKGFLQKNKLKNLEDHIRELENLLDRLDRLITDIVRLKLFWMAAVKAQIGELLPGGEGVVKDVFECHLEVDEKAAKLCGYARTQIERQLEILKSILKQVKLINAMTM